MGHTVDQNLLSLVQQDLKEVIKKHNKIEAEQAVIKESLAQQKIKQTEMENIVTSIQDQQSVTSAQLEEHVEQLEAVVKEYHKIVKTLVSVEKTLNEELLLRTERVEKGLAETDERVQQLEQEVRSQKMKEDKQGTFFNSLYQEKQNRVHFSTEVFTAIPVTRETLLK